MGQGPDIVEVEPKMIETRNHRHLQCVGGAGKVFSWAAVACATVGAQVIHRRSRSARRKLAAVIRRASFCHYRDEGPGVE